MIAVGVAAALIVAMAVWLWNGPGDAAAARLLPFVLQRQPDGAWPELPEESSPAAFSAELGGASSHTQHNTSQFATAPRGSRFACSRVAVFTADGDAVEQAIARDVVTGLQNVPEVQTVSYAAFGAPTDAGARRPDLVVVVDAGDVEDDTVLGTGQLRATLELRFGNRLAAGTTHVVRPVDAPHEVDFGGTIGAETTIDRSGFATPNARRAAVADALAGPAVAKLLETVAELRDAHGLMPALPAAFYPRFHAAAAERFDVAAALGDGAEVQELASWCGRFVHHERWWRATVPGAPEPALDAIAERLVGAGWSVDPDYARDTRVLRDGALELRFVHARGSRPAGSPAGPAAASPARAELFVCLREHATPDLRAAAMEEVLVGDDLALLVMCMDGMRGEQRRRAEQRLERAELREPAALLRRARLRRDADRLDAARDDLMRAAWFADAGFTALGAADDARKAAEEMGLTIPGTDVDPRWLESVGVPELAAGADGLEAEATRDAPVRCYVRTPYGVAVLVVGLRPDEQAGALRGAVKVLGAATSSQWGMGVGRSVHQTDGGTVEVEFVDDPGDGRALVRVTRRD